MVHGTDQNLYFGYGTAGAEGNAAIISTAGVYIQLSDRRLKKDIQPLINALATIDDLKGVQYRWKDEKLQGTGTQLGFIAQEIELVVPQAVSTGQDGITVQPAN